MAILLSGASLRSIDTPRQSPPIRASSSPLSVLLCVTHIDRLGMGSRRLKAGKLFGSRWLGRGRRSAVNRPCEPSLWQRPGEEGSSADRSVTPIRMTNRASIHILPILGWSSDLMGLWGTYHASIIFWSSTSSRLDGCLGKLVGYSHFDFEPSLSPPD